MLILSCLLFSIGMVGAQVTQASGVVVDDTGDAVIGASVVVKGTNTGTVTDIDGQFSVSLPAGKDILVISYVGMKTVEVKANQNLRITLQSNTNLDELVVTAMGITRSEKSLGYTVSKIDGDELLTARSASMLNSLAGKMAGVTVNSASGSLGGSSKIIVRGANSLDGKNQPLFVVDGVPIDNGAAGSTTTNVAAGSVDTGNRANDLNPDDIESMSVLKGAAAAALYGARAKNGVIVITTKKGSKNSKLNIEVNSTFRFDKVAKLPEYQNEYAQGAKGVYDRTKLNGWGPKITGQTETNFLGQDLPLQAYPDNVKDFYETGHTYINSIALSGGSEVADYRVSFSATNQTGTIPETALNKYTTSVNVGYNFTKKLSTRASVSYYNIISDGRPSQSSNNSNVLGNAINFIPRTVSNAMIKDNWIDANGNQISMAEPNTQTTNNPYWILNRNKYKSNLERVILNNSLVYKPIEGLTFTDNIGIDYYNEDRRQVTSMGTFGAKTGAYTDRDYYNQVISNDLIVTFERSINSDFDFKAIAGHNLVQNTYKYNILTIEDLTVDGLYNPSNGKTKIPTAYFERTRLTGVYADFGVSYRNYLYLNVTGRNDWSSKLPEDNRSYFYPSISSSFVFSEILKDTPWLSFGNLRASLAEVGSDGDDAYRTAFSYSPQSEYYTQYTLSGSFPNNGLVGFSIPRVYPSLDLKPQRQRTFEIGTNLKFLNNRIGLDFTYYDIATRDQIVRLDVPLSTGYFSKYMNVGKVTNKGFEVALNLVPVATRDFTWNLDVNFAANRQKVVELDKNNPELEYSLASGWSGLQVVAKKGESMGLYGKMWERNENGEFIIDAGGKRQTVTGRLGNINPDWTMGINNSFRFKSFSLSFLLDIRQGGVMYSGTATSLITSGLAKQTLLYREGPVVDKGVVKQADGSYAPNTTAISGEDFWTLNYDSSISEGGIYNASYVKLRELRFGYSLPISLVKKWSMTKLEIAFEASNLWTIKDHVPHVDPETSIYGVNSAANGVEFNSVPSTRSFGVNLRLGF